MHYAINIVLFKMILIPNIKNIKTNKIVAKPNSCKNTSATLAPNRPKKLLVFSIVDTLLNEISFLL